jgi:hypothetical protein
MLKMWRTLIACSKIRMTRRRAAQRLFEKVEGVSERYLRARPCSLFSRFAFPDATSADRTDALVEILRELLRLF